MLRVAEHFSRTDTGRQRRANEDSFLERSPMFVVADGMGGARAGEVASRVAVELFEAGLGGDDTQPALQRLAARVVEANTQIHELSRQDSARAGMGTTLTAAYVGTAEVSIAHVGDSRAYRFRRGRLERLTEDHSLVSELVRSGRLTEEEAEEHPQRSIITRALGPEPEVEVDTLTVHAQHGDLYILCSDGLTSMIGEARIGEILRGADGLEDAARALIAAANEAGGRDNITVVLFRLEDPLAPAEPDEEDPQAGGEPAPLAESDTATAPIVVPPSEEVLAAAAATPRPFAPRRPRARRRLPRQGRARRRGAAAGHRRSRVLTRALIATVIVCSVLAAAVVLASQTIYFISTDANGQVTVYNGLPYSLVGGIRLYSAYFVSGVTVAELSPLERARLFNNKLRTQNDATGLVSQLELDKVPGQ